MRQYLDTHQICKNASWYEYGMNYNYEDKSEHSKVRRIMDRLRQCSNWLREVIFGTQSSWFFVYGRVLRNVRLPEVTQRNNILSYKVGGKDDLS